MTVRSNPYSTKINYFFREHYKDNTCTTETIFNTVPLHCRIEDNDEADRLAGHVVDHLRDKVSGPYMDFRNQFKTEKICNSRNEIVAQVKSGFEAKGVYFEYYSKNLKSLCTRNVVPTCGADSQHFDYILLWCSNYEMKGAELFPRLRAKKRRVNNNSFASGWNRSYRLRCWNWCNYVNLYLNQGNIKM